MFGKNIWVKEVGIYRLLSSWKNIFGEKNPINFQVFLGAKI
jgi:hypothetical protein